MDRSRSSSTTLLYGAVRVVLRARPLLRSGVALGAHAAFLYVLAVVFSVAPGLALAQSTTYVRVIPRSTSLVPYMSTPARATMATALASPMAAGAGSVALRLVAGAGWAGLAVAAGMTLYEIYYSSGDVASLKQNAGPALQLLPSATIGTTHVPRAGLQSACGSPPTIGCTQALYVPNGMDLTTCTTIPVPTSPNSFDGWIPQSVQWGTFPGTGSAACYDSYTLTYSGSNGSKMGTIGPYEPSSGEIATYVDGLSSSDPDSMEAHADKVGTGHSPTSADSVVSQPVTPSQLPSTVVAKGTEGSTDSVVADPAAGPAGPNVTASSQVTSTTTTTQTTTSDGTTTTDTETTESATMSCDGMTHDERTMGDVLSEHMSAWEGSGLLGALALLEALTWPDELPTIHFDSDRWGNHAVDFSNWSGIFTVLRTLTIAGASYVAYRIVFVGG